MAYQTLIVEVEDKIALVRLNRPEAMNSLTPQLLAGLSAALDEAQAAVERIEGFTAEVPAPHLAQIAGRAGVVLLNDLGAGSLVDLAGWGLRREPTVAEAVADHDLRQEQERRRLLYVAMTRAESWLIVAAAGDCGSGLESWHSMIATGAERCTLTRATIEIDGIGSAQRLSFGEWPDLWTWAGSALVVAAGIYTIWREAQLGKTR